MIGSLDDTTKIVEDSTSVGEEKTFKEFDDIVRIIVPISCTQAWISDDWINAKLLSLQCNKTQVKPLHPLNAFVILSKSDFIGTHYDDQVIRVVSSADKESVIMNTKPLHPTLISKTQTDQVLVTLRDDGNFYKLQPSSRRLVLRMTRTGDILHTYEFRQDGTTRLFTFPTRAAQNGNTDICVVNCTSYDTGELIVLHQDGQVRACYREHEGLVLDITDVACDSDNRIIVLDFTAKCIHLLDPDVSFVRHLPSDMFDNPLTMALYQGTLWVGFTDGTVKAFLYRYGK